MLLAACAAPPEPATPEGRAAPASFENAVLATPMAPFFETMRDNDRAFYDAALDTMWNAIPRGSDDPQAVEEASFTAGRLIRRQNADRALDAPDAALKAMLISQVDFLQPLEGDPAACAIAARSGAPNSAWLEGRVSEDAVLASAIAAAEVLTAPRRTARAAASPGDMQLLLEDLAGKGVTAEDLASINDPAADPVRVCRSALAFLRSAIDLPGPAGERVRAFIARETLAS